MDRSIVNIYEYNFFNLPFSKVIGVFTKCGPLWWLLPALPPYLYIAGLPPPLPSISLLYTTHSISCKTFLVNPTYEALCGRPALIYIAAWGACNSPHFSLIRLDLPSLESKTRTCHMHGVHKLEAGLACQSTWAGRCSLHFNIEELSNSASAFFIRSSWVILWVFKEGEWLW